MNEYELLLEYCADRGWLERVGVSEKGQITYVKITEMPEQPDYADFQRWKAERYK